MPSPLPRIEVISVSNISSKYFSVDERNYISALGQILPTDLQYLLGQCIISLFMLWKVTFFLPSYNLYNLYNFLRNI